GNHADNSGGGISNVNQLKITNSTIGENTISEFGARIGGGMRNVTSGAAARLANVTINHNSATQGAAIANNEGGQVQLRMTILASSVNRNCQGTFTSLGHNLDSGDTCGLTGAGDLSNTDPLLAPLGDNGGPTNTYRLTAGSPAIDSGENLGCPLVD